MTEFVKRITRVIVFGVEERREGKYRLWLRHGTGNGGLLEFKLSDKNEPEIL